MTNEPVGPGTDLPDFDADTAVTPLGEDRYGVTLLDRWNIVDGPNGGYLAAIMTRAMSETVAEPARALRSLTVHFLSRPRFAEAEVEVELLRTGRSLSTLQATLRQEGGITCRALAAFSVPWTPKDEWRAAMPDTARREGVPMDDRPVPVARNWRGVPIADAPFFSGDGSPRVGQWIRAARPRALDAIELVAIADAVPPAGFPAMTARTAMPTIDLTVHIRAPLPRPAEEAEELVYAEFTTVHVADGFAEEDGTVWSAGGVLLAQSRQLAITN